MFDRFTDRARKVLQLANEEAHCFNHGFVGTEHILLGLVREGSGVAAHVLKNLEIDVRKLRLEIEKIVQCGPERAFTGKRPLTPRSKKVIEYAQDEARNLNHKWVGTEHLLLGLIREGEGLAAQVLLNLRLNLHDVREEVLNLLGHNITPPERPKRERTVLMPRPLMSEANPGAEEENRAVPTEIVASTTEERERIRTLELQIWNVRIVLGALVGTFAGFLLFASIGAAIGLLLGGLVAALEWRTLGALSGGGVGALLASNYLPNEGGSLAGVLLCALVGFLIADIGHSSERRRTLFTRPRR